MNALQKMWDHKQSFWYDFISRDLIKSGKLAKLVKEDGLRGMTSNPTIFEKAISAGSDYDEDIKKWALKGLYPNDIFEELAVSDIQKATEIILPIFKESKGIDGFVSLEVNPNLANSTEKTVAEAKKLWKKVNRPNLMIKVPGTAAGLPAIQELTAAGLNINITLLFSVENYKKVLEAYLKGLEARVKKGQPIKQIASVASFFVSRVDTIIDKSLDQIGSDQAKALLHKAGIANAKLAYDHYLQVKNSPRWKKLEAKGANPQRLLWASTGTKDKRMSDVVYINELMGPESVNTMPPATAEAFKDHGILEDKITVGVDQAKKDIAALADLGVNLEAALQELQDDGVRLFSVSFETLMRVVTAKREILTGTLGKTVTWELGSYQKDVDQALQKMESENWIKRIWEKDAPLWKSDADHQAIIKNSLGWLSVPAFVQRNLPLMNSIAADIKKAKFTHILLLGMGGSSLCPEVLRLTFGKKPGWPDLAILDSTEPASVQERVSRSNPEKTLFIVASKSGSTTEPNAFLAYCYDLVKKKKGAKAGDNFIAITDPGTSMERVAKEKNFRHIVLNPPDIGGRYSALSFFGMLPAALMGLDVQALLLAAIEMADACSPMVPATKNPGAQLGAALGTLALKGRNKVTFFINSEISTFSTWVEQLIAESTGKEGKGILPVESEGLNPLQDYSSDRVFVSLQTKPDVKIEKELAMLKKAGHPIIRVKLPSKTNITAEFFRWEFATAVASALMGIDAFDQPNVQESKDLTKKFLEQFKTQGSLDGQAPISKENGFSLYAPHNLVQGNSVEEAIKSLLDQLKPGDYVAILAYLTRNPTTEKTLQEIRLQILKSKKVATTLGFGPRFLHSTGQLHKGGDNNGVFLQITADDKIDLPIPGEPYTYKVLKEAQALGDLSALMSRNRRAVRIHLKDAAKELPKLKSLFKKITEN